MLEHARFSPDLADLASIYEPGVHLAVAERRLDADAATFVAQVLRERSLPAVEWVMGPAQASAPALVEALGLMGPKLAAIPGFDAWCADLDLQRELFASLFELDAVGVRVATLHGPMCPRFHVDHIPCRLITTYGGRGTEWLPEPCVDRSLLGRSDLPLLRSASGDAIQVIEPGCIALFRGEGWEGGSVGGVVHRSPHIGEETPRLLLTLDFVH